MLSHLHCLYDQSPSGTCANSSTVYRRKFTRTRCCRASHGTQTEQKQSSLRPAHILLMTSTAFWGTPASTLPICIGGKTSPVSLKTAGCTVCLCPFMCCLLHCIIVSLTRYLHYACSVTSCPGQHSKSSSGGIYHKATLWIGTSAKLLSLSTVVIDKALLSSPSACCCHHRVFSQALSTDAAWHFDAIDMQNFVTLTTCVVLRHDMSATPLVTI